MKDPNEEHGRKEFSWSNFFLVTGISFLAFTGAMRLLDGVTIRILLQIGLISLGLGVVSLALKWMIRRIDANRRPVDSNDKQHY